MRHNHLGLVFDRIFCDRKLYFRKLALTLYDNYDIYNSVAIDESTGGSNNESVTMALIWNHCKQKLDFIVNSLMPLSLALMFLLTWLPTPKTFAKNVSFPEPFVLTCRWSWLCLCQQPQEHSFHSCPIGPGASFHEGKAWLCCELNPWRVATIL